MGLLLEIAAGRMPSTAQVTKLTRELERERQAEKLGVGKAMHVFDYFMVRITLSTGLRISELSNLEWRDIRDGFLIVRYGKGAKKIPARLSLQRDTLTALLTTDLTPAQRKRVRRRLARVKLLIRSLNRRIVYFGQQTQGLFASFKVFQQTLGYRCGPRDRLFQGARGPLTRFGLHERWAYWKIRVGLPAEITFHSLRHYYATWLLERGVSLAMVQRQLGHASAIYTAGYLHHTSEARSRIEELL